MSSVKEVLEDTGEGMASTSIASDMANNQWNKRNSNEQFCFGPIRFGLSTIRRELARKEFGADKDGVRTPSPDGDFKTGGVSKDKHRVAYFKGKAPS
jgi:hypothetical protein